MLPQEEEQEFQTLLQLFKAEPTLQNELSRVSYEDLFSDAFMAASFPRWMTCCFAAALAS